MIMIIFIILIAHHDDLEECANAWTGEDLTNLLQVGQLLVLGYLIMMMIIMTDDDDDHDDWQPAGPEIPDHQHDHDHHHPDSCKMTGGTPEVRSNNSLTLLTFNI